MYFREYMDRQSEEEQQLGRKEVEGQQENNALSRLGSVPEHSITTPLISVLVTIASFPFLVPHHSGDGTFPYVLSNCPHV